MLLQKYFAKLETVPETISTDPETISGILSQKLWLSKHIIIDNSTVNFTKSSEENINFIDQMLYNSISATTWLSKDISKVAELCHNSSL